MVVMRTGHRNHLSLEFVLLLPITSYPVLIIVLVVLTCISLINFWTNTQNITFFTFRKIYICIHAKTL